MKTYLVLLNRKNYVYSNAFSDKGRYLKKILDVDSY